MQDSCRSSTTACGRARFPLIYISHNITKFGHDPASLLTSPDWAGILIDPDDQAKVATAMARALEKDAQGASIEYRLCTGDGSRRWVENRYVPVRDKEGRLIEVEGIVIDITERKAAEEHIALLARSDALTGLANRDTFTERLHQAYAAAQRGATRSRSTTSTWTTSSRSAICCCARWPSA